MKLSKDQLSELENLAACFFTPGEIAIVLDVPLTGLEDELLDEDSPAYKAYQRGKLRSKLELHKTILTQAKQGSGPAQSLAMRLLNDLEANEL